jgi:ribonuclease BN (tRNA processing enzyme)
MRLTILGSSASYAGARRACAGHYLEAGGARVLFDCGNGVVSNLAVIGDPTSLDAVFVTHSHPDHFADLYCLQAALQYSPQGPVSPIPLFAPPGLTDQLKCLLSERGARAFDDAFVEVDLVAGEPVFLGGLTVTPVLVEHTEPTFGLVAEAEGLRLGYTADTGLSDGVRRVARGADLLLAEATLPKEYAGTAPHLTAAQAGELAREAEAGALVLVHVWPTNDRRASAQEATATFGAPVVVANEFDVFEITRNPEEGQ